MLTLEEVRAKDPHRASELLAQAMEQEKKNPTLYKTYKQELCLECDTPRDIPSSRYCSYHQRVVEKAIDYDRRNGRTLDVNYGYSEPGFNWGMNAYVHGRDHFKRLTKYLEVSELLVNTG